MGCLGKKRATMEACNALRLGIRDSTNPRSSGRSITAGEKSTPNKMSLLGIGGLRPQRSCPSAIYGKRQNGTAFPQQAGSGKPVEPVRCVVYLYGCWYHHLFDFVSVLSLAILHQLWLDDCARMVNIW